MLHDFRSSPAGEWICAACGRHFSQCQGVKASKWRELRELGQVTPEAAKLFFCAGYGPPGALKEAHPMPWDESMPPAKVGDVFSIMAPFVVNPPTLHPTRWDAVRRLEELAARVALRRLEANDDPARRAVYESWKAFDEAMAKASYVERHEKTVIEVRELERWLTL